MDETSLALGQVERLLRDMAGIDRFGCVLFVSDSDADPLVQSVFCRALDRLGVQPVYVRFPTAEWSHQEPPRAVGAAMQQSELMIHHLRRSITHAPSTRAALERGSRLLLCKGTSIADLASAAVAVDYAALQGRGRRVAERIVEGGLLACEAPNGTQFCCRVRIRGRPFVEDGDLSRPGSIGVLPSGMVAWSQTGASGRVVFDALDSWGVLDPPLTCDLDQGRVIRLEGGGGALAKLETVFERDEQARFVGEIGIGINEGARFNGRDVNGEAKRAAGLVHVGLGNSIPFGGSVRSDFHIDGIIPQATISIDGEPLVRAGRLTV